MQIRRSTGLLVLSLMTAFFLAACGGGGDSGGGGGAKTPVTTTLAALPITIDNATLNGAVNPNGDNTVAWFEWSTDSGLSPFNKSPNQTLGSGTADIPVTFQLTGLNSGTTYYFRVAASNPAGTVKGTIVSFATAAPNTPPTVQTLAATNTTITGTTLNGSVIPNALATNAWFQWGTDNTFTNPNATNETVHQAIGSGTTSVQFNATLSNLLVDTVYYFRIVAQNSAGQPQLGLTAQFRTSAQVPTVTTQAADNVTTTGATLHGLVNPNGLLTTALFQWGTDNTFTNPALFTTTLTQGMGSGLTAQPISALVSVSAATTYYFRVVANNSAGPSTATFLGFSTPLNPPPTADAGPDQTVYTKSASGSTVVDLDGSGSSDPYGTITKYKWTGPVALDNDASPTPAFTAPAKSYGESENLEFQLTVTDDRGLSGTDNVTVTVKWGFLDDFSTNTTGTYTLAGSGSFAYDSGFEAARVTVGGGAANFFSHTFGLSPSSDSGVFSLYYNPQTKPVGSGIEITLGEDGGTYYKISTLTDNVVKWVGGVEKESVAFPLPTSYSTGSWYLIKITFTPGGATIDAFGQTVPLTFDGSIPVFYFGVLTFNHTAIYDDFTLESLP